MPSSPPPYKDDPRRLSRLILKPNRVPTYCKPVLLLLAAWFLAATYSILSCGPFQSCSGFRASPLSEEEFISKMYQTTIDAYDPIPISAFCAHDHWNSSMAISCDGISGDTLSSKQRILTCLRRAMQSGTGFIIPKLETRSFIILQTDENTILDHSFNRELFISRLKNSCPEMKIYNTVEDATQSDAEVYRFESLMSSMNICDDEEGFATNFGSLLMFPSNIYRLAFSALYTLSMQTTSRYIGFHLPKLSSTLQAGPDAFEIYSKHYLGLASTLAYSVVYLTSDETTSVSRFKMIAKGMSVISKEDVLSQRRQEELNSLPSDQRNLVDYLILERAGFFAGFLESSFSWNVAGRRSAMRAGAKGICEQPAEKRGKGVAWRDDWSEILGVTDGEFERRLWP